MKNSTLFFRSMVVVAIIAGAPHLLAISAKTNDSNEPYIPSETAVQGESDNDSWKSYWVGKYEVSFEGTTEKAHYEIREKSGKFECYSILLIDAKGNKFKDNTLVMESLEITNDVAEGEYQFEYEEEKIKVKSNLKMNDEGDVSLSYDYYGYKGKENWKRIK